LTAGVNALNPADEAADCGRMRRGGAGPAVSWVPRSLRLRLNRYHEQHGWQKPYEESGNKLRRWRDRASGVDLAKPRRRPGLAEVVFDDIDDVKTSVE